MPLSGQHKHPALRATSNGLLLRVRVTPKASADAIESMETGADGVDYLKLKVRAVPGKGQANAAVIKLLAKALGVAQTQLAITGGAASRIKTIRIAGADAETVSALLRL